MLLGSAQLRKQSATLPREALDMATWFCDAYFKHIKSG